MVRALLVGLALVACSAEPEPVIAEPLDEPEPVAAEPEPEPACRRVFTPDAELAAYAEGAAARWSAATGCEVVIGDDGLRIELVPELLHHVTGRPVNGRSTVSTLGDEFYECKGIVVSAKGDDLGRTVQHEMGHCLGGVGHTDSGGLMDEHPESGTPIDEAALVLVCAGLPCVLMTPEH